MGSQYENNATYKDEVMRQMKLQTSILLELKDILIQNKKTLDGWMGETNSDLVRANGESLNRNHSIDRRAKISEIGNRMLTRGEMEELHQQTPDEIKNESEAKRWRFFRWFEEKFGRRPSDEEVTRGLGHGRP